MRIFVLASILAVTPSVVSAQEIYGGISYSMITAELTTPIASVEADPTAINFTGGISLSKNLALEGVVGLGVDGDDMDVSIFNVTFGLGEVELDKFFGVYAVGIAPLADGFDVYAKIGFADIEFEGESESAGDSGIAYGIGAKVEFSDQISGAIEYNAHPDAEVENLNGDVESKAVDLRLNFKF